MQDCLDWRSLSGDCATRVISRLPSDDAAGHHVLIAVACRAGVSKTSEHLVATVAVEGIDAIRRVVGGDRHTHVRRRYGTK